MANDASPASKNTKVDDKKYDLNSTMPLLLASMGNPGIDYRTIAKLDNAGRTHSAWEHQYRKWKVVARQLIENNPDIVIKGGIPAKKAPSKRTVQAAGKGTGKTSINGAANDDDSEPETESPTATKKRSATTEPDTASPTKKAKTVISKKSTTKPKAFAGQKKVKTEDEADAEEGVEMEFEEAV